MTKKLPGIKEAELVALGPCVICGKKPLETGETPFYRVRIERGLFNPSALQRRAGLEMMIGGLAAVMGPDEDLAQVFDGPHTVFVHEGCAMRIHHLLELIPKTEEQQDAD